MIKVLTLVGLLGSAALNAHTPMMNADALKQALEQFKPAQSLSGFTPTPPEEALNPSEDHDGLKAQGHDAMRQNKTASHIVSNEKTRTKVIQNPDSAYLQYAERLIDAGDAVKEGGCTEQPPKCTTNSTIETCDERAHYKATVCNETLQVVVNRRTHHTKRSVNKRAPFDLAHCAGREWCKPTDEVHVSAACQSVVVVTKYKDYVVGTNHDQTCTNLKVNIDFKSYPHPGHSVIYDISVTEKTIEDRWDKSTCKAIADKVTQGVCHYEKGNACIDANVTKIIDGIAVKRACWGARYQYQCFTHSEGTCAPWINQGCSQTMSTCVKQDFGVCVAYLQTFECAHTTCIPEPDVCMPELPCTDGSCDTTQNEKSQDMAEGVSRLGALAGAASDVATKQVNAGMVAIFAGTAMECEKFPLGTRDCCTDSGWGDWVLHCPKAMQDLQKAKADHRVVYVGEYDDWILGSVKHYTYCIFPSKLSSIIQIQGRGAQLHIPFGTPKAPDCRGISPEELERLAFDQLDLSSIELELTQRLRPPDLGGVTHTNQAHIERLNQSKRAYDKVDL